MTRKQPTPVVDSISKEALELAKLLAEQYTKGYKDGRDSKPDRYQPYIPYYPWPYQNPYQPIITWDNTIQPAQTTYSITNT